MDDINFSTITNEEYKSMDEFRITYGIGETNFGNYLIATARDDQVCYLSFFDEGKENSAIDNLQMDWPNARLQENTSAVTKIADRVFAPLRSGAGGGAGDGVGSDSGGENKSSNNNSTGKGKVGKTAKTATTADKLAVLLRGTELQCNVWKELTHVKPGSTVNYEQIARAVGNPRAIRAVASAIAKNKLAYLIPCHRVIRKTGAPNKYRWGPQRKMDLLKAEAGEDTM